MPFPPVVRTTTIIKELSIREHRRCIIEKRKRNFKLLIVECLDRYWTQLDTAIIEKFNTDKFKLSIYELQIQTKKVAENP